MPASAPRRRQLLTFVSPSLLALCALPTRADPHVKVHERRDRLGTHQVYRQHDLSRVHREAPAVRAQASGRGVQGAQGV
jgi:hypothetical protein